MSNSDSEYDIVPPNTIRQQLICHKKGDAFLGSPMLQQARQVASKNAPNAILYKPLMDPIELLRLEYEHPNDNYDPPQSLHVIFKVKERKNPPGRRPNPDNIAVTKTWLERRFPTGYRSLGSPLYQHAVNRFINENSDHSNLVQHLCQSEFERLSRLYGHRFGVEQQVPGAACYYPDHVIIQWPTKYVHKQGWPRGLKRGKQPKAPLKRAGRRAPSA